MTLAGSTWSSPAFLAGLAALIAGAALAPISPLAAAMPLAAYVVTSLAAPFFPAWSWFLPTWSRGPRHGRRVALTFDDGPDPVTLAPLLALLHREEVKATFFLVGQRVQAFPAGASLILAGGHTIGNHSWSHDPWLMLRSVARLERDLRACQQALARVGVVPLAFRPPVGITNPRLPAVLQRLGLRCVTFRIRPLDFSNRRLEGLAARILDRAAPGDFILLHDVDPGPGRLQAWLAEVAGVIAGLRAAKLEIAPLEELSGGPVMRLRSRDVDRTPAAAEPASRDDGPLAALSSGLSALLFVGYPVLAYLGLRYLGARAAALLLLLTLGASQLRRARVRPGAVRGLAWLGGAVAGLLLLAALLDDPRFLLAYPALVSFALLAQFAWSLRTSQPMVERFARLQVDDLTPAEVGYCRSVTSAWCAFLLANGLAATLLAGWGPREWWAAYTGFVAYLLMGLLFAGEYVVRKARFGRFNQGFPDRLLVRLLRHPSTR